MRWALSNLGVVQIEADCSVLAEQTYRTALQLDPRDPICHANLGVALLRQGRDSEAQGWFERTLVLDPNAANARDNLELLEKKKRASFGGAAPGEKLKGLDHSTALTTALGIVNSTELGKSCEVEISHPRGANYTVRVGEPLSVVVTARCTQMNAAIAELCIAVWAGQGPINNAAAGTLCTRTNIHHSHVWGPRPALSKATFEVGLPNENKYMIAGWSTPTLAYEGACSQPVGVLVRHHSV